MSYQEPGKSQIEFFKKVIDANTEMTELVESSDTNVKAATTKCLIEQLQTGFKKVKNRKSRQRSRRYREEENGNFGNKKYNN